MYCFNESDFIYNQNQFYVYQITNKHKSSHVYINTFLSTLSDNQIEIEKNNTEHLFIKYILFEDFVNLNSDKYISVDILATEIQLDDKDTNRISIKDILYQIEDLYKVEYIYWYHDSVLDTIFKMILKTSINLFYSYRWSSEIVNLISQINTVITNYNGYISPTWISGFNMLSTLKLIPIDKKIKYLNSPNNLNYIHLKMTSEVTDLDYLKSLLDHVNTYLRDSECVDKYINFIRTEPVKYYIPFIENKIKFYHVEPIILNHISNGVCDLFNSIYSICFQAYNLYQNLNKEVDVSANSKLNIIIANIIHCFSIIIKMFKKNDFELKNIAYNVVIILLNYWKPDIEPATYMYNNFHLIASKEL